MRSVQLFVGGLLTLGALLVATAPGLAQPTGEPPVRVVVRTGTIEALPLLAARARGVDRELGLTLQILDSGAANPVLEVARGATAAVATGPDLFVSPTPDVRDAFNFYARAPVALVADGARGGNLERLVISASEDVPIEVTVRRAVERASSPPRFVPGSGWFGMIGSYGAGQVDGALAEAPLPAYLTFRRGAVLVDATTDGPVPAIPGGSLYVGTAIDPAIRSKLVAFVRGGTQILARTPAEDLVDLLAPEFVLWEPDAVLEAVQAAKRALNPEGRLDTAALREAAVLYGAALDDNALTRIDDTSTP